MATPNNMDNKNTDMSNPIARAVHPAISLDDIVRSLTMIDSYTRLISSLSLILFWGVVNVKEEKVPFYLFNY